MKHQRNGSYWRHFHQNSKTTLEQTGSKEVIVLFCKAFNSLLVQASLALLASKQREANTIAFFFLSLKKPHVKYAKATHRLIILKKNINNRKYTITLFLLISIATAHEPADEKKS